MRALRVFRDDASLSANPDLWGSIQQALDGSRYFILLASPAAAQSPWVAKEAEHWIEQRGTAQLLVVLTEGELDWEADGRVDGAHTSALPAPLAKALDEEPRYVDLRWARTDTQLAQRDARFRGAIADLAAPIHGRSKDDMLGEDVRQHKRTLAVAWTAAGLLAALAIAASVAAVLALQQRDRARTQSNIALSRQLAAESVSQLDGPTALSPVLAVESFRRVQRQSDARIYDARNAMLDALQRSPRLITTLGALHLRDAVFSPDGKTVATGDRAGNVQFWDARDGRPLGPPRRGSSASVSAMAFSPDGRTVAVGDETGRVMFWDARTRRLRQKQIPKATRWIQVITFSRDGKRVAVLGADSDNGPPVARVWRTASLGKPVELPRDPDEIENIDDAAFTPNGKALVTADSLGDVRLWTPGGSHQITGESGYRLAGDANGRLLLLARSRGGSRVVDAITHEKLGARVGETGEFFAALAPGGRALASAPNGSTLELWNLRGSKPTAEKLLARQGNYTVPVFGPGGNELASVGNDGTVKLWDARPRPPLSVESLRTPHLGSFAAPTGLIAVGPHGEVATADGSGVTFWSGSKETRRRVPQGAGSMVFSPDGRLLAATSTRGIDVWSVPKHRVLFSVPAPPAGFGNELKMSFSADSKRLATATPDGLAAEWDVSGSRPVLKERTKTTVKLPKQPCNGNDPSLRYAQCGDQAQSAALTADGTLIYATTDGQVKFWKLAPPGRSLGTLNENGRSIVLSPDGLTLATLGKDGVQLWNVERRQPLGGPLADPAGVISVEFASDGSGLATGDEGGGVTVWDPLLLSTSFDAWRTRLCRLAGRNLTRSEWSQLLPGVRYRKTCPGLP